MKMLREMVGGFCIVITPYSILLMLCPIPYKIPNQCHLAYTLYSQQPNLPTNNHLVTAASNIQIKLDLGRLKCCPLVVGLCTTWTAPKLSGTITPSESKSQDQTRARHECRPCQLPLFGLLLNMIACVGRR